MENTLQSKNPLADLKNEELIEQFSENLRPFARLLLAGNLDHSYQETILEKLVRANSSGSKHRALLALVARSPNCKDWSDILNTSPLAHPSRLAADIATEQLGIRDFDVKGALENLLMSGSDLWHLSNAIKHPQFGEALELALKEYPECPHLEKIRRSII